jgi:hypothetical protein
MLFELTIILAFFSIGAGLKYIDDAFDEAKFSKKKAIAIAPVIALIWIALSLYDPISATILFSVLLAVLLSGKIDNLVFLLCTIAIIAIPLLTQMLTILWIPLFLLTFAGIIDEKGNDYVDTCAAPKLVEIFFSYRFCMKSAMLSLCILSVIPWLYLLAFLAFDVAYELVRSVGKRS